MNNKLKNNTLNLYPIDYPFETLVAREKQGKLILDPSFQRKYKWDKDGEERSSRFIESCLMRIPLPACYFAENSENNHEVIDGVQRITTIKRFFLDEFRLEGLTVFTELEGKLFSELDEYRAELETTTIRCIILRKENPKELVQEIFARLNQGAVELTPQEIRHAISPGTLDNLLLELSNEEIIKTFGQGRNNAKRVDSREGEELVLRFLSMDTDLNNYDNNLLKHMDRYMSDNQNIDNERIEFLRKRFKDALSKCQIVFKDNIFVNLDSKRQQQSLAFYDLQMWGVLNYDYTYLKTNQNKILDQFQKLCELEEFKRTLSGGTQQKNSILKRRQLWEEMMHKI